MRITHNGERRAIADRCVSRAGLILQVHPQSLLELIHDHPAIRSCDLTWLDHLLCYLPTPFEVLARLLVVALLAIPLNAPSMTVRVASRAQDSYVNQDKLI